MKRISIFASILAIASIGLVSCKKVEEEQIADEQGEFEYTFILQDGVQSFNSTRAILGEDENGLYHMWQNDDQLTVITNSTYDNGGLSYSNSSKVVVSQNDPITFTIKSNKQLNQDDWVYCSYPYVNGCSNPESVPMSISDEQEQNESGFNASSLPMVAAPFQISNAITTNTSSSENEKVAFNAIASVIEFDIFSPNHTYVGEKIKSITFTTSEDNDYIAGGFTFDLTRVSKTSASGLSIDINSEEKTSITVELTSDLAIANDNVNKDNAAKVYMVVAPGSHAGALSVKTDKATYNYTIPERVFSRAAVRRFGINMEKEGARQVPCVSLPWSYPASWDDGANATTTGLNAIYGVTSNGLGDYASNNAPYLIKLDNNDDHIQVTTDRAIGAVSIKYKMIGGANSSTLTIKESNDGSVWTTVETLNISGIQNSVGVLTTANSFKPKSRHIDIIFSKGSNVGIGGIAITKGNETPRIEAEDVVLDALGITNGEIPFEALYFDNDVIVAQSGATGCVASAAVSNGKVVYTVGPNYGTIDATGTIVLVSANNNSITKTINVTQSGDTFSQLGATEDPLTITIPANSEVATFTITSAVFGWNATAAAADTKNLSFRTGASNTYEYPSAISGDKNDAAQIITIRSTTSAPTSGDPITLGSVVVYRNNDETNDSQKITITVNKAVDSGFTPVSFSWDGTNGITKDYSLTTVGTSTKTGYYQDNSGTVSLTIKKEDNSALFTTSPSTISVSAKIGAGSSDLHFDNYVYVCLIDSNGNDINSTVTQITNHVNTNIGDTYNISIPVVSTAYGVKVYHVKESGRNIRYYSVSLTAL